MRLVLDKLPGTEAEQKEFRGVVAGYVGVIPHRIEDVEREMRAELERFRAELAKDGLTEIQRERALEITKLLEEAPGVIQQTTTELNDFRNRMVRQLFAADTNIPFEEFLK
jgi:hypothetical protein